MIDILEIASCFSDYNRSRKYKLFIDQFKPIADTKILDVGASEKEYQKNANILEKKYLYPNNITVLGVDNYKEFNKRYPKVKTVTYKGDIFPFNDKEFDICWCNAVIEHSGGRSAQERLLWEIHRVAKTAFITTPNRYFPIEVHTRIPLLHYLPKQYFDKVLNRIGKSWATGNYMHLFSLSEIKRLLERCNIANYKIIKNKIFGFTVDFVIVF